MSRVQKTEYYISLFLKGSIGLLAIISFIDQDFYLASVSIFFLFLTFLPAIAERRLKIRLPIEIDLVLTIIIYLHFFLGMHQDFYNKIEWWDLFLHTSNSAVFGISGFVVAYTLTMTSQIKAKPLFIALYSIFFAITIGALWEILEFSLDQLFGTYAQKGSLNDTMTDLIVDTVGAICIGIIGYLYIKNPRPGLVDTVIKRVTAVNKK